jgi:hypothetical protein
MHEFPFHPSFENFLRVLTAETASFFSEEKASYTTIYLALLHWENLAFSVSLVNVSFNFWRLNDGRFNKVVGIHKFKAPLIRD